MNLTVRRISGGDLYSRHSRTKRPSKGQAAKISSYIHRPTPDGTEICKGAE